MHDTAPILVNERKFTAHILDYNRARALISHYCAPDPVYYKGTVNSIYFDTHNLSAFDEKINGDTYKRKYRLRWYDVENVCSNEQNAFIEIKYRYGSARDKLRKVVSADPEWLSCVDLRDSALRDFLYKHACMLDDNLPLNLYPALCITYDRLRFCCRQSGLTVCIDTNIRVNRINPDFFSSTTAMLLNVVVCEIKGHNLPMVPWADALYKAGFRLRSFSKYGECINQILHLCSPTVIRMSI